MLKWLIQIIFALLLISCNSSGDPNKFVEDTKKSKTSNVEPLPPLKEYELLSYTGMNLRDPFTMPANATLKINTPQEVIKVALKRPDADRKREYLENMPLDSLTMVGTVSRQGETWALIIDKTGMVHKVKQGNYIGQNSGKIKKISINNIEIEEIVNDASGSWVNRKANLSINSNDK